ncbi:hypothetical protein GR183_15920 [Stappia sp. GBMRC 2046]|uniref:Neurotransmitter-gated ion-channel ligand binding domain-containing protein n=1 Tax=Stappia sediminis TaxID=2692190 RepID=A0A7X3LWH6_9HYPH|nr:hypothetical protein [Stappia sediminis]MXN66402.1 hypothetical protein [Stappia sediminis]
MKTFIFIIALMLMAGAAFVPAPARADVCELPDDYRTEVLPGPEDGPTVVEMGILVADITGIDDVGQSIEGDFIIRKQWQDPRLEGVAGCRLHRSQVWFPVTDVLNSNLLRRSRGEFAADQVRIGEGGVVVYLQRFFGTVATYHQLQQFPFDMHDMTLRLAAFGYPKDKVQLTLDMRFTSLAKLLNIPDWEITGIDAEVVEEPIPELLAEYSMVKLYIHAKRNTSYYIWKVLFPLALIVIMSFLVFWINPERFGPQIGLSATSMLTLIAFQFALTTTLPKVGYLTLMDKLILGSTVLVFGSLIMATITAALVVKGQSEKALKIDQACRWLFPLALVGIWAAVLSRL